MSDDCKSCLMLVEARKHIDFVEKPSYCRACYKRADAEVTRLKEALESMACQFGGWSRGGLMTGGLSALEEAFEVLGWEEPHKIESMTCDEPGCDKQRSCGWPSKDGYRHTCSNHYSKEQ